MITWPPKTFCICCICCLLMAMSLAAALPTWNSVYAVGVCVNTAETGLFFACWQKQKDLRRALAEQQGFLYVVTGKSVVLETKYLFLEAWRCSCHLGIKYGVGYSVWIFTLCHTRSPWGLQIVETYTFAWKCRLKMVKQAPNKPSVFLFMRGDDGGHVSGLETTEQKSWEKMWTSH